MILGLSLDASTVRAEAIPDWLPRYDFDIRLDLPLRRVVARERVTFTNRHVRPAKELVFSAYARYKIPDDEVVLLAKTLELLRAHPSDAIDFVGHRLEIDRVTLAGSEEPLPFHWRPDVHTALVVDLPREVRQGESVSVEIHFQLSLPDKQGRWGHRHGVTTLANWYPILAYYDEQGWQPTPFVAWHQPFFNEAGVYSARFVLPADQKVACTGTIVKRHALDEHWQCLEIVAAAARDFTLVASHRFVEWTRTVEECTIHVLAFPEHEDMARKALEFAAEVIPIYNRWFGHYPFTDFYIVESYFPWNGNQNAGIVLIDHRVFQLPKILTRYLDHLISHETLHQWWWNVVGVNGYAETFMDEAVACFYTARRLQHKYGYNAPMLELPFGQGILPNVNHEDYRFYGLYGTLARREETKTVQPLPEFGNIVTMFSMCYDRGAKILGMIEERIGETAFFDFMKLLYTRYQFRILRVADFQRELEEYTGYSWQEFFDRWLHGVGASDWAIQKVTVEEETDRDSQPPVALGYRVAVQLRQQAEFTEPTWLGVKFREDQDYVMRIPIRPGNEPQVFEDPPCRIVTSEDGREVRVVMSLPRKPRQISIDPDQVLLDKEPANNHWKAEVAYRLPPVFTNLSETGLTTAYDRWNLIAGPWLGTNQPQFGQRAYAGFRAAAYRLEQFQGGIYTAYDFEDADFRAGADALFRHLGHPNVQAGLQYDHSLSDDWANLKRDRGRLFARYVFLETPSLYLDPIHYVETYGRIQRQFEREQDRGRYVPPDVESYDDSAGVGLRYYRNYQTPYWDPEGGYKLDLNYELGLPIVGTYDGVFHRLQGEVSLVKALPADWGYWGHSRWAARLYGGAGWPDNGYHFQLGGPNRFRGFNRDDREGDMVWVGTLEWRFPLWREAGLDVAYRLFHLNHVYGVAFYDVGAIYLDGRLQDSVAHAAGFGLRLDMSLLSFIERATLRFDVAKTLNDPQPVQFWFGLSQAF